MGHFCRVGGRWGRNGGCPRGVDSPLFDIVHPKYQHKRRRTPHKTRCFSIHMQSCFLSCSIRTRPYIAHPEPFRAERTVVQAPRSSWFLTITAWYGRRPATPCSGPIGSGQTRSRSTSSVYVTRGHGGRDTAVRREKSVEMSEWTLEEGAWRVTWLGSKAV